MNDAFDIKEILSVIHLGKYVHYYILYKINEISSIFNTDKLK